VEVTLPQVAQAQAVGFLLVLARVGGLFALAPVFSGKMIPMRAKLVIAGALALALTPLATAGQTIPSDVGSLAVLLLKEIGVGLAFAFSIALLAAGVQAAAALLDTLVGFSFAMIVDPMSNQQGAVLGQFFALFATMIFLVIGGDQMMIMGLARSYELLPLAATPDLARLSQHAVATAGDVFTIGLQIAAPGVIAILVADAALGVVARAVPQMNVFVVGMPAKILAGFAVIAASLPFIANHLQADLEASVLEALRALSVA
jgi:flagellar biosynthesis protein FliR